MQLFHPTVVLRHRRENLKKCSLRGLESRPDFRFYTYPKEIPQIKPVDYVLLGLEGPPLTEKDAARGVLLIDGTWRYAEKMFAAVVKQMDIEVRSLPAHFRTAYPRRQEDCVHPERGLASVEALYIAYALLKRDPTGLLDNYYWKNDFLKINHGFLTENSV